MISRSISSRELIICRIIAALDWQKEDKYGNKVTLAVDKGFSLL
jgi:hypothetical protein